MNFYNDLISSLSTIKIDYEKYYEKLLQIYEPYKEVESESVATYAEEIFKTDKRSYFTICSKESFNSLTGEGFWGKSIIYSPLNDHSRCFMHKGDIVFCYRQGQFDDLKTALEIRGIYALGFVASEPELLFPEKESHNKYGVAIVFPFILKHHLELKNIQLNPITISLTPYNGNRNDALQYIPESIYSDTLIGLICNKNPDIKDNLERVLQKNIQETVLPERLWNSSSNLTHEEQLNTSNFSPSQIIYYGVPGSGKSHKIDKELNSKFPNEIERAEHVTRVVFHPEYTNADFVGQIMPTMNDSGVAYKFKTGPFTSILKKAWNNLNSEYYLVIEEINRGNAAAIFGDIFQLLDRDENGYSSYSIDNLDINYEIRKKNSQLNWTENTGIRLPPNLSILATMNTSDKNVFTLDNAFQRRWDMELVKNECNDEEQMNAEINIKINDKIQTITWKDFQKTINAVIGEKGNESGLSSMEDKRLGCWFVKSENKEIKIEQFKNKVLKYLWDDAFKFCRSEVFTGDIKNFEELQEAFDNEGFGIFAESCNISSKIKDETSTDIEQSTQSAPTETPEA